MITLPALRSLPLWWPLATLSLLLSTWQPAWAAASPAQFQAAYESFSTAQTGSSSAIDEAATRFEALAAAEPGDVVLQAYAGATQALRARTTWLPWKKMSYAEDGLALIDKALAQLRPADDSPRYRGTPASLETRFTAASTFLALPAMFNRHERGQQLLTQVLSHPLFDNCPLGFKAAVWLRAGQAAADNKQPDQARAHWQRVVQLQAPQAGVAQARLKELSQ